MVKSIKLQFTQLQNRIFRELCVHAGKGLSLSQIARQTNATTAGVSKASKQLVEWDLATINEDEHIKLSLLQLAKNKTTAQMKQIENLAQIYESGIVETLEETYPGTTIILFGSYSKGEDTIRSDIDIAILGSKKESTQLEDQQLQRPIRINTYKQLSSVAKELQENMCNGIVLSGSIEL